jgi:hypothetical protein
VYRNMARTHILPVNYCESGESFAIEMAIAMAIVQQYFNLDLANPI